MFCSVLFFFCIAQTVHKECVHEIRTIDLARELDRLDHGFNSAADANARNSTNSTSNPLPTEIEIGYPLSDNVMDLV